MARSAGPAGAMAPGWWPHGQPDGAGLTSLFSEAEGSRLGLGSEASCCAPGQALPFVLGFYQHPAYCAGSKVQAVRCRQHTSAEGHGVQMALPLLSGLLSLRVSAPTLTLFPHRSVARLPGARGLGLSAHSPECLQAELLPSPCVNGPGEKLRPAKALTGDRAGTAVPKAHSLASSCVFLGCFISHPRMEDIQDDQCLELLPLKATDATEQGQAVPHYPVFPSPLL